MVSKLLFQAEKYQNYPKIFSHRKSEAAQMRWLENFLNKFLWDHDTVRMKKQENKNTFKFVSTFMSFLEISLKQITCFLLNISIFQTLRYKFGFYLTLSKRRLLSQKNFTK